MADIVPLFKALADENRIKIAALIVDRALTVEEIARATSLPLALALRHIGRLQAAGLAEAVDRDDATTYRFCRQPLLDALRATAAQPEQTPLDDALGQYEQKVLSTFLVEGRLKSIPAQQKKREVILRYLTEQFERERMYGEREVNALLARFHEDVASLRRYLVDTGLLERRIVRVIPAVTLYEGAPQVDHQIMYWRPADAPEATS